MEPASAPAKLWFEVENVDPEERYDMPLYEYVCTQCKRHTEKIQKFSDTEITECPHCGGLLERVVSAPAIAFKGGGWYADGYGNAKPSAKGDSKSDSGGSSDTASKSGDGPAKDTSSAAPASTESSSSTTPVSPAPTASGPEKK